MLSGIFQAVAQIDTSSASFYQVYTQIFKVSCAMPACHDGTFEPDFRTPESAYNTTVYHPIIKNNIQGQYKYRITPYDNINSLLYERISNCCFVNSNDRMPMTLGRDTLVHSKILLIADWIKSGAKDITGHVPQIEVLPSNVLRNYIVSSNDTSILYEDHFGGGNDHHRVGDLPYNSLIIPSTLKVVNLRFGIISNEEELNLSEESQLEIAENSQSYKTIKSLALKKNANFLTAEFNPDIFQEGKTYFMRVKIVMRHSSTSPLYYPTSSELYSDKLYWSFVIKK